MPLYQYECTACGHLFETIEGLRDDPCNRCPACGAARPPRIVAPFRTVGWSSFLDGMEKRVNPEKFK